MDDLSQREPVRRVRTLFISDVHLGSRSCQARALLKFLEQIDCEQLYLVGDIVDTLVLRRSVYWPDEHSLVLRRFLDFARAGTEVFYVPGNHDDPFRQFVGSRFNDVRIESKLVHTTAQGKRLLVLHGDELDTSIRCANWLRHVGHLSYVSLMRLHRGVARMRERLGLPYWSLAAEIKGRVGRAVEFVDAFEQGMVGLARHAGTDGVVCGHIHHPAVKEITGLLYCNDGDWVESCSALVEHANGELELLRWAELQQDRAAAVADSVDKLAA